MKINITNFMIGFLVLGFVLFGILAFTQPLISPQSNNDFGGSNSTLGINFSKQLNPTINETQSKIKQLGATSSIFDIVGFFINGVWTSITGLFDSFVIMDELTTSATNDLAKTGNFGGIQLLAGLISSILIVLLIGLMVYILIGREI